MKRQFYIVDFDTTFIQLEALDELAKIVLENHKDKDQIVAKIEGITSEGMNGNLSFDVSLRERLKLLRPTRHHVETLIKSLKKRISQSIVRNKQFFKKNSDTVYIVSGGFIEYIFPVVESFGIRKDHVYGNTFVWNKKGEYQGYNTHNILAQKNGKVLLVKQLHLEGEITVIGDGYTDLQIKQMGAAKRFVAFTENKVRDSVLHDADQVARSFDEFLYVNKLPMALSYPKSKIKVVLFEKIHADAVSLFQKEGYLVESYEKSFSSDMIAEKIRDASIIGIRSRTLIHKEVLQRIHKAKAIGAYCIGTNQIDLSSTTAKGIAVFNAPFSNTRSVTELALAEIVFLMRGIPEKNAQMHKSQWNKSATNSHEVRGKTLGIVGYGHIGSQLSVLAENMGMRVIYFDIADTLSLGNAKRITSLRELLVQSDIVTLHIDGRKENSGFFGEKQFSLMKKDSVFLNLSRGFVVDVVSLIRHLKSTHLRGAAIDVFQYEPKSKDEKFISELCSMDNVILTPHIAGSTEEAQKDIGVYVTKKIIDYINTGSTEMSVNMPIIHTPLLKGTHRLLHIHRNVPGMLSQINSIFAQHKINIEHQTLKTTEEIGYVITDVDKRYDKIVLGLLQKIPQTIRFRTIFT